MRLLDEMIRVVDRILRRSGYNPIYSGITAKGGVRVGRKDKLILADQVFSFCGSMVWVGLDPETRDAYYLLQLLGECDQETLLKYYNASVRFTA